MKKYFYALIALTFIGSASALQIVNDTNTNLMVTVIQTQDSHEINANGGVQNFNANTGSVTFKICYFDDAWNQCKGIRQTCSAAKTATVTAQGKCDQNDVENCHFTLTNVDC